jgi:hypothetical protein
VARGKRVAVLEGTRRRLYPALRFEDGSWYREESKWDMPRLHNALD